jgi:hypothetical protein
MPRKLFICSVAVFINLCPHLLSADSFIGINPFSINVSDSTAYTDLHKALFKRLQYELLPYGIKPALMDELKGQECVAIVGGRIEEISGTPVINFHLSSTMDSEDEIKRIPLTNHSIDEVLDLLALKTRYFLEQNVSGKVRISSVPLECDILLNGIKIGRTPAELVLEKGVYNVRLEREHLYTFTDTLIVAAGKETSLQAEMSYKGYRVRPWVIGSSLLTLCTAASWIIEHNLHLDYKRLPRGTPQDKFNSSYNRYRNANYLRISLLNSAILGWTVSGFQITRNKALKKRIFGRQVHTVKTEKSDREKKFRRNVDY